MKARIRKSSRSLVERFRAEPRGRIRLKDFDPGDTAGLDIAKAKAQELLRDGIQRLAELQDMLYAQDRWSLLVIFQAPDAAGKDSTIKHVMSGVNPQGVTVSSFKQPSSEELDHDYLWRAARRLPERGRIGIFNRSYYEEVLVVRAHEDVLLSEKLPEALVTKNIWKERYDDINAFERYLSRNGYRILKFFLHVSRAEQKKRFLERLEVPDKNWKFSLADVRERSCWKDYQVAFEDMIRETSTKWAPWYVIPADHKWFTRLTVAAIIIDALEVLGLRYPKVDAERRRELAKARRQLARE
jgi:PPK2 family polyphosphate:nucleotide phosphotransferase